MIGIVSFGQCDTIFLLGLAIIGNLIINIGTVSIKDTIIIKLNNALSTLIVVDVVLWI